MLLKLYIFCVLTLFSLGCQHKSNEKKENWLFVENGACYMDSIEANRDFEKGIFVVTLYDSQLPKNIDHEKLKENLNHFRIDYKPLGENCTGEDNCYGKHMLTKIEQRFGITFVDSIYSVSSKY
ncbi:MAG: hypothetical protein IPJ86_00165 [Bacteroidetes bacterium]|nr:hypothetical protein [Bacteroidota bacterium]